MGAPEIHAFLSYLSNERDVSLSTHHQALCALLFLYKHVLQIALPWIDNLPTPAKPVRQPTVLTRQEIDLIFAQMTGTHLLIAQLLYGTGMRLMECTQLRVKDIDFQRREITIRQGKRSKDRLTMLPPSSNGRHAPYISQGHWQLVAALRTAVSLNGSAGVTHTSLWPWRKAALQLLAAATHKRSIPDR